MFTKSFQNQNAAWIVLVIGLIATGSLWFISEKYTANAIERRLGSRVLHITEMIKDTLRDNERNLWLVGNFLNTTDNFDKTKWQTNVSDIPALENWQALREIGLIIPIAPEGDQSEYTSNVLHKTLGPDEQLPSGHNMWSDSTLREVMINSRDTGLASSTGPQVFPQEADESSQRGFLTYLPLYKTGMPLYSVEDRRLAFRGWIYSHIHIHELMKSIQFTENTNLAFKIYDGQNLEQKSLLYDNTEVLFSTTNQNGFLTKSEIISVHGRQWAIFLHLIIAKN